MTKVTRWRPGVRSRVISDVSLIGLASSQAVRPVTEFSSSFAWLGAGGVQFKPGEGCTELAVFGSERDAEFGVVGQWKFAADSRVRGRPSQCSVVLSDAGVAHSAELHDGGIRWGERLPAADQLLFADLEVADFAEFGEEADEVQQLGACQFVGEAGGHEAGAVGLFFDLFQGDRELVVFGVAEQQVGVGLTQFHAGADLAVVGHDHQRVEILFDLFVGGQQRLGE